MRKQEPITIRSHQMLGNKFQWIIRRRIHHTPHVFDPETREEYALDRLWSDAARVAPLSLDIDLEPETAPEAGFRPVPGETLP